MDPKDRLVYAFSAESGARLKRVQEIRERLLNELNGGLWHTTLPDRYEDILSSGFISPEPDIPEAKRWSTSAGKASHPYVRTLGGVSLFDFASFDPETYSQRCPMSNWQAFVPFPEQKGHAVWIEISRKQSEHFISGEQLLTMWKAEIGKAPNLMPHIEAAHIGPVPKTAFKRAFLVREEQPEFISLGC